MLYGGLQLCVVAPQDRVTEHVPVDVLDFHIRVAADLRPRVRQNAARLDVFLTEGPVEIFLSGVFDEALVVDVVVVGVCRSILSRFPVKGLGQGLVFLAMLGATRLGLLEA